MKSDMLFMLYLLGMLGMLGVGLVAPFSVEGAGCLLIGVSALSMLYAIARKVLG